MRTSPGLLLVAVLLTSCTLHTEGSPSSFLRALKRTLDAGNTEAPVADGAIRLADGEDDLSGRVEVFHDGVWGSVCDDNFFKTEGDVVCRSLGHAFAYYVRYNWPDSKINTNKMWLYRVSCQGRESSIVDCEHQPWGTHQCSLHEAVGVFCAPAGTQREEGTEGAIRLVGGPSPSEGRLEIFHAGFWGTVCIDEYFDKKEANVVCKQLSLPMDVVNIYGSDKYGPGSGPINKDYLQCLGAETKLTQCHRSSSFPWNYVGCDHSADVGIQCAGSPDADALEVRLVGGTSPGEGLLQVKYKNRWGAVCRTDFTDEGAHVACRMLGLKGGFSVGHNKFNSSNEGPMIMDEVTCVGTESSLSECAHAGYKNTQRECSLQAGVMCIETQGQPGEQGDLRLVDGDVPRSGRLEIFYRGYWGTVSRRGFGPGDADVACRQLGYGPSTAIDILPGYWRVWTNNVDCSGLEDKLTDCYIQYRESTMNYKDAYIACEEAFPDLPPLTPPPMPNAAQGDVRLVNGPTPKMGRVEVYLDGGWGSLCNRIFDHAAAKVVCRQLGLPGGRPVRFGEGPSIIAEIQCTGQESNVTECDVNMLEWGCNYNKDAGLVCEQPDPAGTEGEIRLVGGPEPSSGRLEIFHEGEWGTFCYKKADTYDLRDEADVICRQLGFISQYGTSHGNVTRHYGWGKNRIWMDSIGCRDNRVAAITDCNIRWIGSTSQKCPLHAVIGVRCTTEW